MTVFWCLTAAIYLGWSFLTNNWQITWIVWVIAAVLSPAVSAVTSKLER